MSNYFLYKGRQTRRYFELKQPRLSPFWYVNRVIQVYTFNFFKKRQTKCISGIFNKFSIRNYPNVANTAIIWMPSTKPALHICETCKTIVSINRFINVLPFYTRRHKIFGGIIMTIDKMDQTDILRQQYWPRQ